MRFMHIRDVRITDVFWRDVMQTIRQKMIPYQWESINDRVEGAVKSYSIRNFRIAAGEISGEHGGVVFQDTDTAKWLEALAYSLMLSPDPELERLADETIDLIGRAQQPDGYLNTYYTIQEPEGRWKNLMEGHELYTAGHMIEAAVAYHQATGKTRFLDIVQKLADNIEATFSPKAGNHPGYPGHQEIEVALFRLAAETGKEKYTDLAMHFLNVRGQGEDYFAWEQRQPGHHFLFPEMATFGPDYNQSDKPVREMEAASGHAVRAVYMYSAMADAALRTGDEELQKACRRLYRNVTTRQMYVTGAIGSAAQGERFTSDFDLPNETVYGETCASVGLMMFSKRMFRLTGDPAYFAIWERALRNTVLTGMNQEGNRFFYVNPLSTSPEEIRHDPTREHVKPVRQKWFGVSCCPTNIARTILSIGGSLYAYEDDTLYILAQISSETEWEGRKVRLTKREMDCALEIDGPACEVRLRVPEGTRPSLPVQMDGCMHIPHPGGQAAYAYTLQAEPRLLWAHPRVSADTGRCAIDEGGVVYCIESIDNGPHLQELYIQENTAFTPVPMDFLPEGMHALRCAGYRLSEQGWEGQLYAERKPAYEPCTLVAVPYSQWNNRGEGEMRVWLPVLPACAAE